MTLREIKAKTKKMLKGNMAPLMLGACLILLISLIFSMCEYIIRRLTGVSACCTVRFSGNGTASVILSLVILVLSLLFQYAALSPLIMGIWRYLYFLARGKKQRLAELFFFYSAPRLFFYSVFLRLNIFLRQALICAALFLLPLAASFFLSDYAADTLGYELTGPVSAALMFAAAFLWICAVIIFIIVLLRYAFVELTAAANGERKINRSVGVGIKRTSGKRIRIFMLTFSFTGWFILCLLILPIIFVLPYFWGCIAVLEENSDKPNN